MTRTDDAVRSGCIIEDIITNFEFKNSD